MSTVVIKLDRSEGEARVEFIVHAAAEHPGRAGVTGRNVRAEMSDTDQTVNEEFQPVGVGRELRAKQNVVLARADAAARFVIAAKIGLESEPIVQVSGERGFPAAAVGQS